MRMIPYEISQNTISNAEHRLFEAFRKTEMPDGYVCLHSVDLPDHQYKVLGELDFVIVSPRGLFAIEVKGGGVSCHDGVWYYENRYGEISRSLEGPFHQARAGMFSLRERLLNWFSENELSQIIMGYAVAFPDCDFDVHGIEWPQDLVLDARRLRANGLSAFIRSIEAYWHDKISGRPDRASPDLAARIAKQLRPDFEMVRSLHVEADRIDALTVKLTEEQYTRLDIIEDAQRILVSGGAGTGKTFLAIEVARRHAHSGQRVLFVCFSPLLARFLSSQSLTSRVTVSSIHELMLDVVRKCGHLPEGYRDDLALTDEWYKRRLVPTFEGASRFLDSSAKYDVLIIDEAQDILNLEYLTGLGNLLRGGLDKGIWRIFYDRFNQRVISGSPEREVIDLLMSAGAVPPILRVNCRNTNEVVIQTKVLTGADLGNKSTGPGPAVVYEYYRDLDNAAHLLETYLDTLRRNEIERRHITILSPRPFEESSASRLSQRWHRNLVVLDRARSPVFPFEDLTFSTVPLFKGLENRFIALTDIDDLDSTPESTAILYVGMSRARARLWVAVNEALRAKLGEISKKNLPQVLKDLGNVR